jgi:hypothetical protein
LVIIDEFDRIESEDVKAKFADLIKRMHDMRVGVRFILCGIGATLDQLIAQHLSSSRPIHPVQLDLLPHDARWEIVRKAAEKLGYEVTQNQIVRIGQISDG